MPSYFIIGTSRNDKLTERVKFTFNLHRQILDYLGVIFECLREYPPTHPPTPKTCRYWTILYKKYYPNPLDFVITLEVFD
jgi:hypothetical protein